MKPFADALLERLKKDGRWPPTGEQKVREKIARWVAYRETDRQALKQIAEWEDDRRRYHVDPLPEKIALAWADLFWGEDPSFRPADESDAANLLALVRGSDLEAGLHRAEDICVSEGEVWWRIYVDRSISAVPLVEWHSREAVVPYFTGSYLQAVAFVQTLDGGGGRFYRRLEIHTYGRIQNTVFAGTRDQLGDEVDDYPTALPQWGGIVPELVHGLPGMLAGRITNKEGRDPTLGVSDYAGIEDYLLDLNEAWTIGHENMRLTAKKRAVVPERMIRARDPEAAGLGRLPSIEGTFAAGEDVFVDQDTGLDDAKSTFQILEYSFDATPLIDWVRLLVETSTSRVGLSPQWIGVHTGDEGRADTGAALRVRLLPQTAAANGKARPWNRQGPEILKLMAMVDAASRTIGGFERPYRDVTGLPAVERPDPLPEDRLEETTRHVAAVGGEIEAPETAIEEQHPEWDEERRALEMQRIREHGQNTAGQRGPAVPEPALPG